MPSRFVFEQSVLSSVVGGKSAIDIPSLNIHTLEQAEAFIAGYGFNWSESALQDQLWYFHRRSLVLLQEKLGYKIEDIPEVLRDRKSLEDLRKLLLWASSAKPEEKDLQKWSCALLRVMHVFVHSEKDLFSSFSHEIQKQILTPIQDCIYHDGTSGTTFLKSTRDESEQVALLGFEVKPFKTSSSTVIKLLAKPNALAMSVFDKLGVRFITNHMFDVFRVVRFLVQENMVSFPHIIPEQSSNNLYPVNVFLDACAELIRGPQNLKGAELDDFFIQFLNRNSDTANFFRKENNFSGADYRFIKFISRKLIYAELPGQKEKFSFFYPFEVQIMDQEAHKKILSGPSEHQAYKERQKQAAKRRLFPEVLK